MEQVTLQQIDHDAYILKNKLMRRFDEHYGTHLTKYDADDLSFFDIITAPDTQDGLELYAEIKTIARHGVTEEQKNFLYKIFPIFSNTDPDDDFDGWIGRLERMASITGNEKAVKGATIVAFNEHDAILGTYHRRPLSILKVQKVGKESVEALLVQNQCILIIQVKTSVEDIEQDFED